MIYYSIPWDSSKNIGKYYNSFMELLGNNDTACFVDGDACFTTYMYGKQLENILSKYPECGLFCGTVNRVGCKWQQFGDWMSNDLEEIRKHGQYLFDTYYNEIEDVTDKQHDEVMGGTIILIRKKIWKKLGGFKEEGILGVDNDIHWKAQEKGEKVYLMKGVYMCHWYRGGNIYAKEHLL